MRLLLLMVLTLTCGLLNAQVILKTEYFGKSNYRMKDGEGSKAVGDAKGSSIVYQGGINVPLSIKVNNNGQPKAWMLGASGAYVKLNNQNFTENLVVDKILNYGLGVTHIRPISKKWSLLLSAGVGVYTSDVKLDQLSWSNVLGSFGAVFICRIRPTFEIGGGLALNNSFGVPMLFPAFYLNWFLEGRFKVNVALKEGMSLSTSYSLLRWLDVGVAVEMNGQMAVVDKDGKNHIFAHQYLVVGLRPEIQLNKKISFPIMIGIHATRTAEYKKRSLKYIFKEEQYFFKSSPYCSIGLKIGF